MTLLQEATTATGPTVRSTGRSLRGPAVVLLVLVLTGGVVGLLGAGGEGGRLDPDSYGPSGAQAVTALLRDGGAQVLRVDTVEAALAADGDLLVVPLPEALAPAELEALAGRRLLVVGAADRELEPLGLPAEVRGQVAVEPRRPACNLAGAARAGDVDLGGATYRGTGEGDVTGCYAADGDATLLGLDGGSVLLGDGSLLTNDRLDERGNASLALSVLAADRVVWLVPRPGRAVPAGGRTLRDLIAPGVFTGSAQLLVVVAVVALWRARRLGRVVEEPLPVVVRAAEAVEGRGRLYRAAGARGQAAEALRAATRERLARRVGAALGTPRPSLVQVVAERTGGDPAEVDDLLYGAAPADDGALVRLGEALRSLEATLARDR